MARIFGKALLAALVAAGTLVAAPAQARDRYHRGGDDDVAIAIGAWLVGLAIGAAIASDGDRHHYGIQIMRDRAAILGGQLEVRRRSEGGTRIAFTFTPASAIAEASPQRSESALLIDPIGLGGTP